MAIVSFLEIGTHDVSVVVCEVVCLTVCSGCLLDCLSSLCKMDSTTQDVLSFAGSLSLSIPDSRERLSLDNCTVCFV